MKPVFKHAAKQIQTSAGGVLVMPSGIGGEIFMPASGITKVLTNPNGISGYTVNEKYPATLVIWHGKDDRYMSYGYNLEAFKHAYKLALQGYFVEYTEIAKQFAAQPQEAPKQ